MSGGNSSNNSFNSFNNPPPPPTTSPFVAYGGGGLYPPRPPSMNFSIPPPPPTTSPFSSYGGGGFYPPPTPIGGFGPFSVPPLPPTLAFDDDEPLPSLAPPPASAPSSHPSAAATITTHPEYPAVAASSSPSSFSVLVQFRAPPAPTSTRDRTPIDLIAVLDVSGSMAGKKLELVKRAVAFIIHTLGPNDRLSIVSFSDQSNRVLPLSCMSETGRLRASAAVSALFHMGGTNIKAGLDMGVRVLDERHHQNPVAGIILLSDGQDTTGTGRNYGNFEYKDYSYLLPSNTTVPIHTFGFGYDHDPRAMHTIANGTGGTFSFIDAEGDVQDAFAMCIGGLLSVAAQKVELMVSAARGVHIASVSSGSYSSKVLGHGLMAVIEFGDLYADEEKDILVHVTVPVSEVQPLMQLLSVKGSYKEPLTQKVVYVDGEAAAIRRPEVLLPEDGVVSLRVDRQRNRLLVGESIKEAQERAERRDFEGAREVLTSRRAALLATASAQGGDGLCGWLDSELVEIQKRMSNVQVYEQSGRAYALAGMGAQLQQRAVAGATMNSADAFAADSWNAGAPCFSASYSGSGSAAPCFGASYSGSGSAAPHGSLNFGSNNIGYQTQAMREMVAKSKMFAPENSSKMNED